MSQLAEAEDPSRWADAWSSFIHLDDMFATARSARLYLISLGGYWGLAAVAILSNSPPPVIVAMLACFAFVFIPIGRLLWVRRWPATRFLIAYVAMINIPGQVVAATKRAGWNLWLTGTVLTALLALDFVLIFTVVAPHPG